MQQYIERVVDLTEPEANQIYRLSVEDAREIVLHGPAEAVGRMRVRLRWLPVKARR